MVYSILLLAVIFASLLLSACAGVDASVLDTAECMGKGTWGAGIAYTMGIRVPEWIEIDPEDIYDSNSATFLRYAEIEYGVADDIDAKLRFGIGADSNSAKLLLKKQIDKHDTQSTAIVLGGAYASANSDVWEPVEHYGQKIEYTLYSAEAQFLLTQELSPEYDATIAVRGNFHTLQEKTEGMDLVKKEFYHAGLRANIKRSHRGFYGIFEVGVEAPLSVDGWHQVYPWTGIKVSWDFKKKR